MDVKTMSEGKRVYTWSQTITFTDNLLVAKGKNYSFTLDNLAASELTKRSNLALGIAGQLTLMPLEGTV